MPLRNFLEDIEEFEDMLLEEEYDGWVEEVFIPYYLHNTPTDERVVSLV